jgi:hypothetical protein
VRITLPANKHNVAHESRAGKPARLEGRRRKIAAARFDKRDFLYYP